MPFTQLQPPLTCQDVHDAGLGDAFDQTLHEIMPDYTKKSFEAEPVSIEVRGVAVALDEEISFSYYRYQSLLSPLYTLPMVPNLHRYRDYCRHFTLQEAGASEAVEDSIRDRALHDFMQDMLPAVHHMPLIRLSVFDRFSDGEDIKPLSKVLEDDNERFYLPVADYITQRLEEIDTLFYSKF